MLTFCCIVLLLLAISEYTGRFIYKTFIFEYFNFEVY